MVINKINVPIYGILIISSILIGTFYIALNLKKEGIKKEYILYYSILVIVFSLIGSISLSRIVNADSLNSYMGAISVIACSLIFNKIVPNKNIYLKYSIISLPLIYSIGKIGCFLVGCCYGIPYNGILSVTYTDGLNISLFPIQALEVIIFFILFILLNKLKKNKHIIELTLIICALSKFLLDFLRYDHVTKIITTNQIISIVVIVIGIFLIIKKNRLV